MLNLIYIAGNPISISNGIGLGCTATEYLNIPVEITNNEGLFEISSLTYPSFFFFHAGLL